MITMEVGGYTFVFVNRCFNVLMNVLSLNILCTFHENKSNTHNKQEACRPDSSDIYNWLSGHRKFTKS